MNTVIIMPLLAVLVSLINTFLLKEFIFNFLNKKLNVFIFSLFIIYFLCLCLKVDAGIVYKLVIGPISEEIIFRDLFFTMFLLIVEKFSRLKMQGHLTSKSFSFLVLIMSFLYMLTQVGWVLCHHYSFLASLVGLALVSLPSTILFCISKKNLLIF